MIGLILTLYHFRIQIVINPNRRKCTCKCHPKVINPWCMHHGDNSGHFVCVCMCVCVCVCVCVFEREKEGNGVCPLSIEWRLYARILF